MGKNWAWIVGLCVAGIYISSAFLPLGIIALVGLIAPESKAYCDPRSIRDHVQTFR